MRREEEQKTVRRTIPCFVGIVRSKNGVRIGSDQATLRPSVLLNAAVTRGSVG